MRLKQECTITQFSVNKTFNINITYFFRIFPKDLKQKRKKKLTCCCCCWFSIFSDSRFATSFTSSVNASPASFPISKAPVSPLRAPLSLPSASLNSVSPLSNCFQAIREVVRPSKRLEILCVPAKKKLTNLAI